MHYMQLYFFEAHYLKKKSTSKMTILIIEIAYLIFFLLMPSDYAYIL